jgi:Ala-tRNA(Pro) deacylase
MTVSCTDILQMCDRLHIRYEWRTHAAIMTVQQGEQLSLPHMDAIAKTLFVHDDKRQHFYLVCIHADQRINFHQLRAALGSRQLTFASAGDLKEIVGLQPGAVSPLGILNDDEHVVTVVIDRSFYLGLIGMPLNINTATVWLATSDLVALIQQHGNPVRLISLS